MELLWRLMALVDPGDRFVVVREGCLGNGRLKK